jgi:hypothetical protein
MGLNLYFKQAKATGQMFGVADVRAQPQPNELSLRGAKRRSNLRITSRLLRFARNDRAPEIATEIQDFECE